MSLRGTLATARRVLAQLRGDHRTVALLLVVPVVLMSLLAWLYSSQEGMFNRVGGPLLGVFPLLVMFLVTSVATLRERTSGTLDRLMTMPLGKADFVVGYALAFGLVAVLQATIVSAVAVGLLGLDVTGPTWAVVAVAVLDALLGTSLGLCVSAFARTEFQAVQFMPVVVLPQLLLCGLLVPVEALPTGLEQVARALPMTYAVDAMIRLLAGGVTARVALDWGVVAAFAAALLVAGAATLRRRTP